MAKFLLLSEAAAGHGAAHAQPVAFGFVNPGMWVALAMTTLIAILVWKKVPGLITSGLDSGIAEIRKQLDEAKALRALRTPSRLAASSCCGWFPCRSCSDGNRQAQGSWFANFTESCEGGGTCSTTAGDTRCRRCNCARSEKRC